MLWKLLAADIECFEGIGAVGTVFEKIFVLTKEGADEAKRNRR